MKKYLIYGLCTTILMAIVLAVGPAIKFFFRGFLLLLKYPLEALCFWGLLLVFYSLYLYFIQEEVKKV